MSTSIKRVEARDAGGCMDCGGGHEGASRGRPSITMVNVLHFMEASVATELRLCDKCLLKLAKELPLSCALWEQAVDKRKLLSGLEDIREALRASAEPFSVRAIWYGTLRLVASELRGLWAMNRPVQPGHVCPRCNSRRIRILNRFIERGLVWWPHCVDCVEDGDDCQSPAEALATCEAGETDAK